MTVSTSSMYGSMERNKELKNLSSLEFSLGKWNVHVGRDRYFLFVLPMPAARFACALDAMYPLLSHKYFD
jgi:hypothetical protein